MSPPHATGAQKASSAQVRGGYDNLYYLFSYQDSRDAFSIPHDLQMLDEVFDCPDGGYPRENHYWKGHSIQAMIQDSTEPARTELTAQVSAMRETYDRLSDVDQASKGENEIPLA